VNPFAFPLFFSRPPGKVHGVDAGGGGGGGLDGVDASGGGGGGLDGVDASGGGGGGLGATTITVVAEVGRGDGRRSGRRRHARAGRGRRRRGGRRRGACSGSPTASRHRQRPWRPRRAGSSVARSRRRPRPITSRRPWRFTSASGRRRPHCLCPRRRHAAEVGRGGGRRSERGRRTGADGGDDQASRLGQRSPASASQVPKPPAEVPIPEHGAGGGGSDGAEEVERELDMSFGYVGHFAAKYERGKQNH
jgi:hypothetical protein